MSATAETGWLPDCVYTGEKFESELAFFADGLGRITRFSRAPADLASAKRLPGQAALPGLVNGHSQALLRTTRGRPEARLRSAPGGIAPPAPVTARLTDDDLFDAARMAFLEMMLSGITCVSEFHVLHRAPDGGPWPESGQGARAILRAAHDLGIRIALVNAAYGRAGFRAPDNPAESRFGTGTLDHYAAETDRLREFIGQNYPADEAWVAVAPQSLRAVSLDYLKGLAAYAHAHRLRLLVPMSERPEDNEACVAEYGRRPAVLLAEQGMLGKRATAIHAVHTTAEEARLIGAARATVCSCPTSGRSQGAPPTPVDALRSEGAAIALGSGNQAQINLWADARLLDGQARATRTVPEAAAPDTAAAWFQALTVAGARSLGAPGGALEVGRPADFFTINLFDPSIAGTDPGALLANVVFALERRAIRDVWIGARPRLANGRHPLQGAIIGRFVELQRRLWGPQI